MARDVIVKTAGYSWEMDGDVIRVSARMQRTFFLDYIRLVRGGSNGTQASVSSNSGSGSTDIRTDDNLQFRSELEEQIKGLLSTKGKLTLNNGNPTVVRLVVDMMAASF